MYPKVKCHMTSAVMLLTALLTACGGSNGAASLRLEPETAKDPKVESFLAAPTTRILSDDGLDWENKREYLEYGTKTSTGCSYEVQNKSNPNDQVVTVELAVDRKNCISLVREGTPSEAHWKLLQLELDIEQQKPESKSRNHPASDLKNTFAKADESDTWLRDSHTFGVKYTDGNQSLVTVTLQALNALVGGVLDILNFLLEPILGGNGIEIGQLTGITTAVVSTTISYAYPTNGYTDDCLSRITQSSLISGSIQPGTVSDWQVTSGGSCLVWNQVASSQFVDVQWEFDADGNEINDPSLNALCKAFIPEYRECRYEAPDSRSHTTTYGSAARAEFYNDDYIPFIFDCRMGVTIKVPHVFTYAQPRSTFHDGFSSSIEGGQDGAYPCAENFRRVTITSSSIGRPF